MKRLFYIIIFCTSSILSFSQEINDTVYSWGYGIHILNGYGFFNGNLANRLSNSFCADAGFNLYYKRMILSLQTTFLPTYTTQDITLRNSAVLNKDSKATYNCHKIDFGYWIIDTEKFGLAPFAGAGIAELTPNGEDIENQPALEGQKLIFMSYHAGLQFDFLFINTGESIKLPLRLRFGYSFLPHTPGRSGFFTASLGLDICVRPTRRMR
jgi:hypothetical protein